MYPNKTDNMTFRAPRGAGQCRSRHGLRAEADYATAYAKNLFKRLTGYPAADPNEGDHSARLGRKAGMADDHGVAYAKDLFKRLRVHPADDRPDRGHRLARFGRMARAEADHAAAYAKSLFKRLTSFPGRAGASIKTPFPVANAIGRAPAPLARWIRRLVLEPYAHGRRRRIAIAQLESLDDRLLADIGLTRNEIEPTVDGILARRDGTLSTSANRSLPAEERRHDLPLAA